MNRPASPGMALATVVAWGIIGFLLTPLLVIIPYSFTPERYLSMPDGHWSLRHYSALAHDPAWLNAIGQSALTGVCAMLIATVVGASAAIGAWQAGLLVKRWVGLMAMLPLMVPAVVTAMALSRTWVALGIFDTQLGVVLAHAIIGVPFVFMTVNAALDNIDIRTVHAARSLGAKPVYALCSVVIPNIKPGLISGAIFAFFTSWDEIVVTLFVSSRNVFTLPRKIYADIRENIDPVVTAVSTLMIVVTILLAITFLVRSVKRAGAESNL